MRRTDRQMDEQAAYELLVHSEHGILSTVAANGKPYGVPLNFAVINRTIYFHGAPEGMKLDNIHANPNACFAVVGATQLLPAKFSTNYESAIVFGRASIVTDDEEKVQGLTALIQKYSKDFMQEGHAYIERAKSKVAIFKLEIESITGKHRV